MIFASPGVVLNGELWSTGGIDKNNPPPPPDKRIGREEYVRLHKIVSTVDRLCLVAITDENGNITYVNKKFCEISKYSRKELIGQNHRILKSGYHPPQFYQGMWKAISSGKTWEGVIKNKAKDGTFYWVKTVIVPIFDQTRKITEYVSIRTEITEQKNVEQKLQKILDLLFVTEQKYRGLFEESPNLERIINMDGTILECNRTYAQKLGYSKDEIIGKSIFDHVSEKDVDALRDSFETWRSTGQTHDREIWFKRKDGTVFPTLLNATTIYDKSGNIIGSNTIIKDIEEIYRVRKEIEAKNAVIKEQLEEMKKISLVKDDFIATVSHELRSPLTPISMHCEMLKGNGVLGHLNKDQAVAVNSIYENAERLGRITDDLLDIQKLSVDKMKFSEEEFRAELFIIDLINDFSRSIKSKGDDVKIKLINSSKEKITIKTDRKRLRQVFDNLIRNAIDFVPSDNGKIEIGFRSADREIIFYVKDNGHGIPQEAQKNLFNKFCQGNTSVSRRHEGLGLGLSISKRIVENLGGRMWFESKEGVGTAFYFSIPEKIK